MWTEGQCFACERWDSVSEVVISKEFRYNLCKICEAKCIFDYPGQISHYAATGDRNNMEWLLKNRIGFKTAQERKGPSKTDSYGRALWTVGQGTVFSLSRRRRRRSKIIV